MESQKYGHEDRVRAEHRKRIFGGVFEVLPNLGIEGVLDSNRKDLQEERDRLAKEGKEVERVRSWISANINKSESKYASLTSYGLKHLMENDVGGYVPNGVFIVAAISLGYKFRIRDTTPNVEFKMQETSIKNILKRVNSSGHVRRPYIPMVSDMSS